MVRQLLVLSVAIAISAGPGTAQGPVVTYDFAELPNLEVNANIRLKKVMGEIGTLALVEVTAGWKNTPHHHTHEQINVGVSGAFDIVTGLPQQVSRLRGLLIPPDVPHHNDVSGAKVNPLMIEFQPVRRTDLPPERQHVIFPVAPSPRSAPADLLTLDFTTESSAWQRLPSGVRVNVKKGQRAAVSAWEIPSTAAPATVLARQLPGGEQFIYVFGGTVAAQAGHQRHPLVAGATLVNPPDSLPLQIRANGQDASLLLVFEAASPK